MHDDDAGGRVWRPGFRKSGDSGIAIVIVAVLLVAAGCGKKGADCDKAVSNLMEVTKADLQKAMPGVNDTTVGKMREVGVARCKEDKWSDEAVKCLSQASSSSEVQTCQSKMPTDLVQKFSLTILSLNGEPAPTRSPAPAEAKSKVEQYIKQHWPGGKRNDPASSVFWDCDAGSSTEAPSVTGVFDLSTKERIAEVHAHIYIPVKGRVEEAGVDVTLVQASDDWKCDPKNSRLKPARTGATDAPAIGMDACAAFEDACKPNDAAPTGSAAPPNAPHDDGADAGTSDAAPASSSDALETSKPVGSLVYTLKRAEFSAKHVTVDFLVKNDTDESETISGLAEFDAVNDEGDQGKIAPTNWPLCSGGVPPHGVRKCKLIFDFTKAQKSVQVEVKGLGGETAYFKLAAK